MRHAPSTLHFSHAFGPVVPHGAIEWEELPSLAGSVRARRDSRDDAFNASVPWDATRPASFETMTAPAPFREALQGLAIRETHEPDLFRHFFGR